MILDAITLHDVLSFSKIHLWLATLEMFAIGQNELVASNIVQIASKYCDCFEV